jgi:hypothetical protein
MSNAVSNPSSYDPGTVATVEANRNQTPLGYPTIADLLPLSMALTNSCSADNESIDLDIASRFVRAFQWRFSPMHWALIVPRVV